MRKLITILLLSLISIFYSQSIVTKDAEITDYFMYDSPTVINYVSYYTTIEITENFKKTKYLLVVVKQNDTIVDIEILKNGMSIIYCKSNVESANNEFILLPFTNYNYIYISNKINLSVGITEYKTGSNTFRITIMVNNYKSSDLSKVNAEKFKYK